MSVDPDAYYNPDAVAIRIEQPLQMPDGGDLKIVPSPVRDPLEMMAPGADRNGQIATLFSVILMEMTRRFSESPEDDIQLLFIDLAQACCRLGIPEEEALITENNRDFQQQPAEEQLFLRYFKIAEDIEEAKPLLASEILDMIAEKQPGFNITKTMILNFGKLLKRNSVPNKRTMRGTCYYVEEVDG